MRCVPIIVAIVALTALTGFRVAPKTYSQGYSDGYAIGYNTTCQTRATYLNGDWDSYPYVRGYQKGLRDGVRACERGYPPRSYARRRWRYR